MGRDVRVLVLPRCCQTATGQRRGVHIKDTFAVGALADARAIAREHPFATIVTCDLRATHMPCPVDDDADELVIVGHVARADPVAKRLAGPVLAIFHGPHGYASAAAVVRSTARPTAGARWPLAEAMRRMRATR